MPAPQAPAPETTHERTVAYLKENALVVVTAESCTAGLIASRLASVPGAGGVLESAFVVHDPKAKKRCLGVLDETLERNNLTSEPVALEKALARAMPMATTVVAGLALVSGAALATWCGHRGTREPS